MYKNYCIKGLVEETVHQVIRSAHKALALEKFRTYRDSMEKNDPYLDILDGGVGEPEEEDSYDKYDIMTEKDSGDGSDLSEGDLARAHWIQLHKTNKQGIVIQNAFIHILSKYKHIKPIWHFGKKLLDTKETWKTDLYEDFYFRHHCASIQAALTMVMENKDDACGMRKLLNEIGAHHFFYDACEPHLDVFEEGIIESMKKVLHGIHALDEETELSWRLLLTEVKTYLAEGISIQRVSYMRQCMTPQEIDYIRTKWKLVMKYGNVRAGRILCSTAIKTYKDLLIKYSIPMTMPDISEKHPNFDQFADSTITALNMTIECHQEDTGFSQLTDKMRDYVIACLVLDVSPALVRKAFMQGLITMLTEVFNEGELSEVNVQTWSKIYRVLEQAVIANIVDY